MTFHRRFSHRLFMARQNTSPQNGAASPPVVPPGLVQSSTTGTTSLSSTTPTASSTSSSAPTTSASSTTQSSSASSSSSSASSSATSTSKSSSSSSTSSSSATSIAPLTTPVLGPTHTTPTYTYSYSSPSLTSSTTPSATSSNASSIGGLSVGAVVGIVGGGLFGILAVLALGTYLLRWWRRHSAERDFVDEYNEPPVDYMPSRGNSIRTREDTFGPPMSQYPSSQSFGASAGMAGQGIMASRAAMRSPGYGGGYGGYPNVDDEVISGAFSSQPQPQAPYNPEAYYVPYNGGVGYQDAVRGYQGQRAFEAPVNIGYAISEPPISQPTYPSQSASPPPAPAPSTSPRPAPSTAPVPRTTAAAALAAAQAAAADPVSASQPQGEQQRKSAVYTEEDAYGGF